MPSSSATAAPIRNSASAGVRWRSKGLLHRPSIFISTHPVLMKMDGRWSSPLLRHLTPADALFLIGAAVALLLGISRRYSFGRSVLVLLAVIAVSAVLSFWLVKPPQNVDYPQYRQW